MRYHNKGLLKNRDRPFPLLFLHQPNQLLHSKQGAIDFLDLYFVEIQTVYPTVYHSVQDSSLCERPAGVP